MKDKGITPNLPKEVDFVVAAFNEGMQGSAMKTAAALREGGAQVDLLLEPKKKVTQTFDYANRVGARYMVFVAPQEWEGGKVRIKDLRLGEDVPDEEKQLDVASGRPRQGEGGPGAVGTDQEDGSGQGLSSMIRSQ